MANSQQALAGRISEGRAFPPSSPLRRTNGEPSPKGVASDRSLTHLPPPGVTDDLDATPFGSIGNDEAEALRLQVIEELQLTLTGALSREEIAERAGFSIRQIGAWTSPSSGKNISLANTVQIVRATGKPNLLEMAANACGYSLATVEDQRDAALGKLVRQARGLIEEVLTA